MLIQLICLWWICTLPRGKAEIHWAYVLSPPLLHPHTWVDEEVTVYVNDTRALGLPSSSHIALATERFNYTGVSLHKPICFTQVNISNCISLARKDNVDSQYREAGIHWDVEYLYPKFNVSNVTDCYPPPANIKLCGKVKHNPSKPDWRTCRNNVSVCNEDLCEWAPLERDGSPKDLIGGLFTQDHKHFFSSIWRLGAAMGNVSLGRANESTHQHGQYDRKNVTVMACVPEPYVLLIGNFSISFSSPIYNTSCINCNITNCVTQGVDSVVILKQPSFVMLPVNLTQPWYKEKSEAILNRIISELARSKRFIGMMIAGIVALVTLVASASASAISLTQEINTAHFVNQLMFNVTTVMTAQEEWDQKIEQKLNILYDTVNLIGDELQQLETLQRLQCHYEYNHVCVTKALYNNTMFPWGQIKNHLQGIWHNCNTSLDLLRLHILIKNVQDAPKLDTQLMDTAHNIIASLKAHFLDINHWIYSVLGFGIGIILLLLMIMIFCVLLRLVQKTTKKLLISTKKHQLRLNDLTFKK